MKNFKAYLLLFLLLWGLILSSCNSDVDPGKVEDTSQNNSQYTTQTSLYPDYYTGVDPIITEFSEFSIELPADSYSSEKYNTMDYYECEM